MIFKCKNTVGTEYEISAAASYELAFEVGAACHGLRLYFSSDSDMGELNEIKAFDDGEIIFNGFCDLQRQKRELNGFEYFVYARSSASVLVDNEAQPFEYKNPSAKQLYISNARAFGFDCALPDIYTVNNYVVSKGTSCFGAVNDFVEMLCGAPVYVDEHNVLRVYTEGAQVKRLDDYKLISESLVINRSEVISEVDYKSTASQGYRSHFKSLEAEKSGICRKRIMNISSLPLWQREFAAKNKILSSLGNYYCVRAELSGRGDLRLYDRVETSSGVLLVCEIIIIKNSGGEKTILTLKKMPDGEMINYVA